MNPRLILLLIIVVDVIFHLIAINDLSISYYEAEIYYDKNSFVHFLAHSLTSIFGQNDFALRLPFVIFHVGSIVLMYKVSQFYLKRSSDVLLSVGMFVMLPGVTSAAILVNSASVVIFFTLLFIYLYFNEKENYYALLLPLLVFVDDSFFVLYLALFVYSFFKKRQFLLILSFMLILVSLYMYGFDIAYDPKVYFFSVFAVYGLIFSPLLFLYFFYSMYRIWIKEEKSIIWYISFVALVFSIVLSFKQRVLLEDFAPFVVIAIPIMLSLFLKSYRIRLPELRRIHKLFFGFISASLVIIFILTHFNKYMYLFIDNNSKHYAYKYHIAKELSNKLKNSGINNILTSKKMSKRLKFYGIRSGDDYLVQDILDKNNIQSVTIRYFGKAIGTFYVSKLHKK